VDPNSGKATVENSHERNLTLVTEESSWEKTQKSKILVLSFDEEGNSLAKKYQKELVNEV
jgi:hypothetical protein